VDWLAHLFYEVFLAGSPWKILESDVCLISNIGGEYRGETKNEYKKQLFNGEPPPTYRLKTVKT